jgi:putative salt-induced outer membrane protein
VPRSQWLAVCLFFAISSAAFADQITLKNGDRLTGTITKSDDKTLVIKTEFAGDVTIQWLAIDTLKSAAPLHVQLKSGQTVVGSVDSADGKIEVATAANGPVIQPKDSVVALRSDDEQKAYEKTLHPTLMQGWAGGASVGFALTGGNSQTKSLSIAFTADRKTSTDDITLYTNSAYATDDTPGASPSLTANTIQAGARYAHNVAPRVFVFGGGDFQTDALQALNLRSILGGGLGFHVVKSDKTTFDVETGLNYTRESYVGLTNNFVALTLGEELTRKLGKTTVLSEKFYIFPDLDHTGQYLGTFNFGTVTKMSKWLGWQNAFGDIYASNPPVGKKQNDVLLTTGLNVTFKP